MIEVDWLKKWAQYAPQSIALKDAESGREYSYREFFRLANRAARELGRRYDIQHGDRVAVLAANEIEYFFIFYALQRLGAIMVPINFRLTSREVAHILSDSEPKLIIYQKNFEPIVRQAQAPVVEQLFFEDFTSLIQDESLDSSPMPMAGQLEDACMILYTSGTTGAPKGAIITFKMLFWNSVNTTLRLNLSQSDVQVSFLPFFHTGGWNVLNTPFLHRGAKIIFIPKFDADQILHLCEQERVTILFGVPTTMGMLRQSPLFDTVDLRCIRYAIVGGEPMPLELIRTWNEKGVPIRQGYGLTEFGPNVFSLNEEDSIRKIGSIGFPNFYIEAKIVNETGQELGDEQIGELALRGPTAMPGYWRNPKASSETIRDGWLYTGDLVRRDSEGYYYVVGRKKDMYKSGGENVYPTEIEQLLRTHPAVQDCAVIGVADAKWGEVGKAFIVKRAGLDLSESDILKFCADKLARFKTPRYISFIKDLPKGDSGKILKRKLTELK